MRVWFREVNICIVRIEDDFEEMCEFVLYLHQPCHSLLQLPFVQVDEDTLISFSQVVEYVGEVILQAYDGILSA